MDEILASIRRIIETGDDRPRPGALAAGLRPEKSASLRAVARDSLHEEKPERPRLFEAPAEGKPAATPPEAAAAPTESDAESPASSGAASPTSRQEPVEEPDAESAILSNASNQNGRLAAVPGWDFRPFTAKAESPQADVAVPEAIAPATADAPPAADGRGRLKVGDKEEEEVAEAGNEPNDEQPVLRTSKVEDEGPAMPDFDLEFDEIEFEAELRGGAGLEWPADRLRPQPARKDLQSGQNGDDRSGDADGDDVADAEEGPGADEGDGRQQQAGARADAMAPLMSDRPRKQVSAAFEDLSRAIREGQLRSMEEMAQEMLRPMLQEWLDDNLPRLVERLVREEIEQVARGGGRR